MFYEPFIHKLFPKPVYIRDYSSNKPSKPLYGYKAVSGKESYEPDDFDAKIVRFIFDKLLKENLPAMEIAKLASSEVIRLSGGQRKHNFSSSTVIRIIRHPEYAGHYYEGKELSVSRLHKNPIISLKEWEEAVRILAHRIETGRGRKSQLAHPLSGFMECEQCNEPYYHKERSRPGNPDATFRFFQHAPYKGRSCNTDPTVNASSIEKLTAMLFLKVITNRGYREGLIKAFNEYEVFAYKRYKAKDEFCFIGDIGREVFMYGMVVLSVEEKKKFVARIEWFIKASFPSTRLLAERFNTFTRVAIEKWIKNKDADRFMLLRTFFERILVGKGRMTFILEAGDVITIRHKNLTDKWRDEIDRLGRGKFPLGQTPQIDDNLDELLSYLDDTTVYQYYNYEHQITNGANNLGMRYFKQHQIPYMHYYERADFVSVSDATNRLEGLLPYRVNNEGPFYVELYGDNQEVSVELISDSILSLEISGKQYLNARYIHRLPEWFYGKNYEYFKIGRRRIIFVREENRIVAKYLKTRGEPETLNLDDAITELMEAENLQYVDID